MDSLKERLLPLMKDHFVALIVGSLGIAFLLYGLVSFYYVPASQDDIAFKSSSVKPSTSLRQDSKDKAKSMVIDIAGAVKNPGVYTLPSGSRVQDVILAAGGLSHDVDRQKVAQMLNLAAPLVDGTKIYIPLVGEQMTTSSGVSANSSGTTKSVQGSSASLININTASDTELDTLPGVGEVTAGKIIENRPYSSVEELVEKKAVGQATFEKIKDSISVY